MPYSNKFPLATIGTFSSQCVQISNEINTFVNKLFLIFKPIGYLLKKSTRITGDNQQDIVVASALKMHRGVCVCVKRLRIVDSIVLTAGSLL